MQLLPDRLPHNLSQCLPGGDLLQRVVDESLIVSTSHLRASLEHREHIIVHAHRDASLSALAHKRKPVVFNPDNSLSRRSGEGRNPAMKNALQSGQNQGVVPLMWEIVQSSGYRPSPV